MVSPDKCCDTALRRTKQCYGYMSTNNANTYEPLTKVPKLTRTNENFSITSTSHATNSISLVPANASCSVRKGQPLSLATLGVTRKAQLTSNEQKLYNGYQRAQHLLRVMRRNNKVPKRISGLDEFGTLCPALKVFVRCQLRLHKYKSKRSYRFTNEEKSLYVSIYRHSPKCYRYLQLIFPFLPSIRTLQRTQSNLQLRAGINEQLFLYLRYISESKPRRDRYCVLLWDEMELRPGLTFSSPKGGVEGLEDFGSGRRRKIADHALVFMIRGLSRRWKQPIAFYFAQSSTKTFTLKACIKQVIQAIHEKTEFRVLASVSDMGPSNGPAVVSLAKDNGIAGEYVYNVNGHEIVHIFDPPHLLKCVRNNFMNKDIVYNGKIAKWEHLKTLYRLSSLDTTGKMTKLSERHVNPVGKGKMRVK